MHKHIRTLLMIGLGLGVMLAQTQAPARAQASPAGSGPQGGGGIIIAQPGQAYIHLSTAENILGSTTNLENIALNGNPNAKLFAIQQGTPYTYSTVLNNHPLGVTYNPALQRWAIYNDDHAPMTQPLAWNVFIPPQDDTLIVHASSVTNTSGSRTFIDNPLFNGHPEAVIFIQHVYNPGPGAASAPDTGVNYYTHTVLAAYDNVQQKWSIMNADGTIFPAGITFFVLKASADESFFQLISSPANHPFPVLIELDNPLINGNPDAQILVTLNYGTGVTNYAHNHRIEIGYAPFLQRWVITNVDATPMPDGVLFNVLVIPPKSGFFVQAASAGNIVNGGTRLDNPDLNNNPDALVYVTQDWNPPDAPNGIFNKHPIGVDYDSSRSAWFIDNFDGATMPVGATFNVYYTWPRGNSFSVSASNLITTGAAMSLTSPLLNQNPGAIAISTYNFNPAGFLGNSNVYTFPVGLKYVAPFGTWQIFSDIGPTFVITQSYNVLVPPANTFTHTLTPSAFGDSTVIDNPLTNGDKWALVFVTPRDHGGLTHENVGVWYDGTHWEIFNENQASMNLNTAYNVFVIKRHFLYLPLVVR